MDTDNETTRERDRLRKIVAALWRPENDGHLLGPVDARLAADCVAWVIGQTELTRLEDAEHIVTGIFHGKSEAETWRLIAYTMEAARDRIVATRNALLDIAAGAAILLACVEEDDTHHSEAAIVRDALQAYDKLRSTGG